MTRQCLVQGCTKVRTYKEYCGMHWKRVQLTGKSGPVGTVKAPAGEGHRWILQNAACTDEGSCLLWPFAVLRNGYGTVGVNQKTRLAHRVMCETAHGPAKDRKLHAAHSCNNRRCVNPMHLSWKTAVQNEADKTIHGTTASGSRNGSAKLTPHQVMAIRKSSLPMTRLAQNFGIHRHTAWAIRRRKLWQCLDDDGFNGKEHL